MGIWLCKCILVLFSIAGYVYLLRKIMKKTPALYLPILSIAMLSLLLLFCGYAGVLKTGGIIFYYLGMGLLLVAVIEALATRKCVITQSEGVVFLVFSVLAILMAAFLYGKYNITHDDYSHWGIIVKRMLVHDALIDSTDPFIQFQSYPQGISVWNYWVCRFVDGKDWTMQWAQFLVNWSCLMVLGYSIGKHKQLGYVLVVLYAILELNVNVPMYSSMSVDTVIALVGAVPFMMLIMSWRCNEKEGTSQCGISLPYANSMEMTVVQGILLGFCSMIKSSGLYFWILFLVTFAWTYRDSKKCKKMITLFGIPMVINVLWMIYMNCNFPEAGASNHAISLERYLRIGATRSIDEIEQTIFHMIGQGYGTECYYMMLVLVLLYVCLRATRKNSSDGYILKLDIAAFLSWMLCLFAMYVFSMEDGEIVRVTSIERYRRTIEIFIYLTWCPLLIRAVSDLDYERLVQQVRAGLDYCRKNKVSWSGLLKMEVGRKDIRNFFVRMKDFCLLLACLVMFLSMPKNPYGPWKGWKMYIDVRVDLERALDEGEISEKDHVIIVRASEYFRDYSPEELKSSLACNEYYMAQYALESHHFSLMNQKEMIEQYRLEHPEEGIVVYLDLPDEELIQYFQEMGFDTTQKLIRLQEGRLYGDFSE